MKLILRPLMPPCSLIILKYAASALPIVPYAEAGPLYGMVWPILISVSDAPGSYFFWAAAGVAARARATAALALASKCLTDMMVSGWRRWINRLLAGLACYGDAASAPSRGGSHR